MFIETIMILQILAIVILGVRFKNTTIKDDAVLGFHHDHEAYTIKHSKNQEQVVWFPRWKRKMEKVF